ncbi:MAG: hypothetical protein IAE79_17465 [Anaerolinea sp.]|nr:hypothetical protein [Anaerolinea sp.]
MQKFGRRASRFAFHISRVNWFGAAALLVAVVAALPLLAEPGLLNTRGGGDSPFLLQRLQQLETAVRDGHFPVRWMPDANYGYGYPFYNYYAPLSIYVTAVFRLIGFSYTQSIQLSQLAAFLLAAVGMFRLARRWWGDEWAGLLTAVAYTVAPFHMVNVYVRGDSLAEFWAMALYPWLILAADDLFRIPYSVFRVPYRRWRIPGFALPRRPMAALALTYAALILSHNISALIFSPFLLLYILLKAYGLNRQSCARPRTSSPIVNPSASSGQGHQLSTLRQAQGRFVNRQSSIVNRQSPFPPLLSASLALLLALALAAWFFVPALAEKGLAQLAPVTEGYFHFSNHFRGWDLVQGRLLFDYNPDGGGAFRMGLVQTATAVFGLAGFVVRRRGGAENRLFVIVSLLAATLMITPLSRWLWEHLPLLDFTQFPWRFLSVQALATALATGGIVWLPLRPWRRWLALVSIGLLLLSGLGDLKPDHLTLSDADITPEKLAQYEWFTGNIGTTVSAEYLPHTVNPRPLTSPWLERGERDRVQVLNGRIEAVQLLERRTARQSWQVVVAETAVLTLPTLAWPGWAAEIDGVTVPLRPAAGSGLITLDVPAGTHTITLRLLRTPVRLWAELLSLAALLLTLWPGRLLRLHKPDRSTVTTGATALFALALLILAVHRWPQFHRPNSDLTWDFAQMGYLHHDAAGVLFTNGARLRQYTYTQDTVAAGKTVVVTLHVSDAQGEVATLALTTPAVYREETAPLLASQTQPLTARTTFTLTIPANAPLGLYAPRLTLAESKPQTPVGQTRGDLFLRPLRVTAATGAGGAEVERPLAVHLSNLTAVEDTWLLQLAWYTQRPLTHNYNVSLRLLDEQGRAVTQFDTQPGYGFRPSSSWPAGQWVNDWLALPLPDDLPDAPVLMVQLYEVGGQIVLNRRLGRWENGAIQSHQPNFTLPNELTRQTAVFMADETPLLQLHGYYLERSATAVTLTLYWEALAPMTADYTRFVHVLDAGGELATQNDAMPQANSYPTSQWRVGEIVSDMVSWPLAALPVGEYRLVVGFYENLGNRWPRLTAVGVTGDPFPNNAVPLIRTD